MLGAIAGDIAGSPWEGGGCAPRKFVLFEDACTFARSTVCSVALADALLSRQDQANVLRSWVRKYPGRGYGDGLVSWARRQDGTPVPAEGFCLDGVEHATAIGWLAANMDACFTLAKTTAQVTSGQPEGIKGVEAIALAVWMARHARSAADIRCELPLLLAYDLSPSVRDLSAQDGATQDAVQVALISALSAKSWLEAVKNAVSIGGDTGATACMAGGIAEALYGVPTPIARKALAGLPPEMVKVLEAVYEYAWQLPPWVDAPGRWQRWLARIGVGT